MTEEPKMLAIFPEDLQELLKFAFAAALGKHPMNMTTEEKANWKEYSASPAPRSTMQRMSYQVEVPRDELVANAFKEGLQSSDTRASRQLRQAQKRAAAANKNAARLFKDASEARTELAQLKAQVMKISPAHRACFGITV